MICNLFHHRIPKHDHFLSVRCLLPPPSPLLGGHQRRVGVLSGFYCADRRSYLQCQIRFPAERIQTQPQSVPLNEPLRDDKCGISRRICHRMLYLEGTGACLHRESRLARKSRADGPAVPGIALTASRHTRTV